MLYETITEKSAWGQPVRDLTTDVLRRFGWSNSERGVVITRIDPDGPTAEAGLREGDLIKAAYRHEIQNLDHCRKAIEARNPCLGDSRADNSFESSGESGLK